MIQIQHQHFVYFIGRADPDWNPPAKVGITNSLRSRLHTIQTSCPFRIEIVEAIGFPSKQMAQDIEKETHKSLQSVRLMGEWFDTCPTQAYRNACKIVRALLATRISDYWQIEDTFTLMGNVKYFETLESDEDNT